jgi:hypothetical protein
MHHILIAFRPHLRFEESPLLSDTDAFADSLVLYPVIQV